MSFAREAATFHNNAAYVAKLRGRASSVDKVESA